MPQLLPWPGRGVPLFLIHVPIMRLQPATTSRCQWQGAPNVEHNHTWVAQGVDCNMRGYALHPWFQHSSDGKADAYCQHPISNAPHGICFLPHSFQVESSSVCAGIAPTCGAIRSMPQLTCPLVEQFCLNKLHPYHSVYMDVNLKKIINPDNKHHLSRGNSCPN